MSEENLTEIKLKEPIKRGDTVIETVQVRKLKGGQLRGIALEDILRTNITTLLKVIPRCTLPPLTEEECDDLDAADLSEFGATIRSFFMTPAETEMVKALIEEHRPKA